MYWYNYYFTIFNLLTLTASKPISHPPSCSIVIIIIFFSIPQHNIQINEGGKYLKFENSTLNFFPSFYDIGDE